MVGVVAAVVDAKWTGTGLKTDYHSTNQRDETMWRNKLIKYKDLLDFDFGTCVSTLENLFPDPPYKFDDSH